MRQSEAYVFTLKLLRGQSTFAMVPDDEELPKLSQLSRSRSSWSMIVARGTSRRSHPARQRRFSLSSNAAQLARSQIERIIASRSIQLARTRGTREWPSAIRGSSSTELLAFRSSRRSLGTYLIKVNSIKRVHSADALAERQRLHAL